MCPKKRKKELISVSNTEYDDSHGGQSSGSDNSEAVSDEAMQSVSRKEVEQISADELWLEAMKRLATAVRQNAMSKIDDDLRSDSNGAESVPSSGRRGADDLSGSAYLSLDETDGDGGGEEADLVDIVRRQWRLIAGIVAIASILGGVILSQLTPMYSAAARLVIEPQRQTLPGLEAIL
ncbi:MAG: Wzz/FepE/Etk N-terminal domain-containing protein, partial [Desulfobulbia bacterium]